MQQSPLASIIVPVYNVERYLDECISSIVDQTYRNLDIIIVDDVSPDRCPELCDRWEEKDKRIRVIHRERNGGLSAARNSGIDARRGEYVSFVDSDDVIAPKMIETLVNDALAYDADIVSCGADKVSEDLKTVIAPMAPATRTFTGEQALDEFLYCTGTILDCAWGKLYRSALLDKSDTLRFPIGLSSEDYYFNAMAFHLSRRVYAEGQTLYQYRMRPGSITNSTFSSHSFDRIAIGELIIGQLHALGYANTAGMSYYRMQKHYDVLFSMVQSHRPKAQIGKYAAQLRKAARPVYRDEKVSLARKARIFCFSHWPSFYYTLNQMFR
ncbi:glycosyltransferase [Bifidobacterium sp. 82T10]|uniref:Glycosyltransferase n=1 Tax=Bifidobacterium miconis TaxID=2834435 RepID=A0ABS6WCZ2_9BIFI|nr:glycosyltransferase [Bifidobacterium miconis]MBW3091722.1 glycosyltransferase [Bifidobacterium miconis]